MIGERERAVREKFKAEFEAYAAACLRLRAKDGRIRGFMLNTAQRKLHEALESQRRATGRVRAVVLKGRQQGISTYAAGRLYWRLTHGVGLSGFILTHLDSSTKAVYEIVRRFHEHCPRAMRPQGEAASRELLFPLLDSACRIGTARAQGVGRGRTVQLFHGAEAAFWPDGEGNIAGALQAVPDEPGTEVILESTSNGAAGAFHALCQAAMAGDSDYRFHFIPWSMEQGFRKNLPPGFSLTAEEEDVKEIYKLDDTQLWWRRRKINELGSVATFRREYPLSPEEAFRADNPQALWQRALIERNRRHVLPAMKRVVVAVDPAVSSHAGSDETGIVVAGLGQDGHGYVLADLSGRYTPGRWAEIVHKAYAEHNADRVVAEVNQGGALVEHTLRTLDDRIAFKALRASRGKTARAEPVAALDEQGRVHHAGMFAALEDQMCAFEPGTQSRCDRVDARVWAVTELMLGRRPQGSGPAAWG
jgi:predicted phage terminase large subunit-like protein